MTNLEYLGIEGGGTRTVGVVVNAEGNILRRAEFPPGNLQLLPDNSLEKLFREVKLFCPAPLAIGIGMAGARDEPDRARIRKAIDRVWGRIEAVITHDLEVALKAAGGDGDTSVLVLSGTGSCCYGRSGDRLAKVGGWGHLLGDVASGYAIAREVLREIVSEHDRHGRWSALGARFLRSLLLNKPEDLIEWTQSASKAQIAALTRCVFEEEASPVARKILRNAADALARDATICARRIAPRGRPVMFVLAGGVLQKQPAFARMVASLIRKSWPRARVKVLDREGAWAAAELARAAEIPKERRPSRKQIPRAYYVPEFVPGHSPTEQRNPASMRFHELSTAGMVAVMLGAEKSVLPALQKNRRKLIQAVELAVEALQRGGRIFYVGAGTSGRLGVLDASECPPTFRASPEMIQGVIAGGQKALWQAVEGAEDDACAGAAALRFRQISSRDLVIGIAASGRTPFVWGALGLARSVGAKTVLLCFNPSLRIEKPHRPDVVIAPNLGPEILTGSTRLKCGTATKLVLNMISTIAMVRLGKVISNLMVDLNPSNSKLRDRAARILQELTGCSGQIAKAALEKNGWVVKAAWAELKQKQR